MPAIERFVGELPSFQRTGEYEARLEEGHIRKVKVAVPPSCIAAVKTFAKLLRNSHPTDLALLQCWLEDNLCFTYQDVDDDPAADTMVSHLRNYAVLAHCENRRKARYNG